VKGQFNCEIREIHEKENAVGNPMAESGGASVLASRERFWVHAAREDARPTKNFRVFRVFRG